MILKIGLPGANDTKEIFNMEYRNLEKFVEQSSRTFFLIALGKPACTHEKMI